MTLNFLMENLYAISAFLNLHLIKNNWIRICLLIILKTSVNQPMIKEIFYYGFGEFKERRFFEPVFDSRLGSQKSFCLRMLGISLTARK